MMFDLLGATLGQTAAAPGLGSVFDLAVKGGVMMIPIPAAGVLQRVDGVDAARAVPGIEGVEITAKLHYGLTPLPEGDAYLGFIFARGDAPSAVEDALRLAHRQLHFTILPEFSLGA